MLLPTPAYFTFLVGIFFLYWIAARFRFGALAVIIFANYFFYARWDIFYLAIIPLASTADFFIGRAIHRTQNPLARRALVSASIILNVGLILSVRYPRATPWILPLSLSFYAFQSLTYTLDIYRRDAEPATATWHISPPPASFRRRWPARSLACQRCIPQWSKRELLTAENGGRALFLIGLGLVKKFFIADYLADNLINRIFDLPKLYSSAEVLTGVYAYAFQLYYDFSGYTDIALGSALLLGIRLPINFKQPYIAQNISDFWRRWHISFSNWLRDYLYFSLPGLRSRWKIFAYVNLIITMAIAGLWHGAGATFLIWGIWHGCGLAAHRAWQALGGNPTPSPHPAARFLRAFATFHFVLIGWIFFRASNVATARDIITQMLSGTISFANVTPAFALVLAIGIAAHYLPKRWYDRSLELYSASPFYAQAAAMALLVLAIQYVASTGVAPFIYTKF